MIPKKLQIKNFLSYGPEPQTIEFLSYNLICLSGKNGHGKSALLDAMTWALWGQARKTNSTSKADEGLVHLGQKHMLVTFDFQINGIDYRVRREFVKTQSAPFSALDFGIVKEDDTFTTLTDKTIKATQNKLEKTIGISYESFINSAFLRQGQANEFSKKSPKERKEILATILQLERFEDLKKIAVEKTKQFQLQLLQKQTIADRIIQEAAELTSALHQQAAHTEKLIATQQQEQITRTLLAQQEHHHQTLLAQQQQYDRLNVQKNHEIKQRTQLVEQMTIVQQQYQTIAAQHQQHTDIEHLQAEHARLRSSVMTHQEKLNKRLELKDQYLTLQEKKQALEKEREQAIILRDHQHEMNCKIIQEQIEQQHRILTIEQKKITDIHNEIAQHTKLINTTRAQINEQTILVHQTDGCEEQLQTAQQSHQALCHQITMTEQQIADLAHKQNLSDHNQDPSCPLCEQNLSASRKKFLEQKLHQTNSTAQAQLAQLQMQKAVAETTTAQLQTIVQDHKKKQLALLEITSQLSMHEQHAARLAIVLGDATHLITQHTTTLEQLLYQQAQIITEYQQNCAKPISDIPSEQTYQTLLKKIDVLQQTGQALGYNKQAHETDYKALQAIEQQLHTMQSLQKELAQQEQRQQQIADYTKQITAIDTLCAQLDAQCAPIKETPTLIAAHLQKLQTIKTDLQAISKEKSDLEHQNGTKFPIKALKHRESAKLEGYSPGGEVLKILSVCHRLKVISRIQEKTVARKFCSLSSEALQSL